MTARRWDLFCRVIDNFGDIAVCWRLARQLAGEHGQKVRLWVDDLAAFARLRPGLDRRVALQSIDGVQVRRWSAQDIQFVDQAEVADVVIEAFACEPPDGYLLAMAKRPSPPCWINLEYLSAEAWVGECHGLASPNPRLGLTKYFFFPGFDPRTGGLLLEAGLPARRQAFVGSVVAEAAFWGALGVPARQPGEARVSLFCYPDTPVRALFSAWAEGSAPLTCLVPEGVADPELADIFGSAMPAAGAVCGHGRLSVRVIPFLDQDGYDTLLWACDANFVRGEDSFVRAQWAERPFVWQPYRQDGAAHMRKLDAFLERFGRGLAPAPLEAVCALSRSWSLGHGAETAWPAFQSSWPALSQHGAAWAASLRDQGDLAARLVRFCLDRI